MSDALLAVQLPVESLWASIAPVRNGASSHIDRVRDSLGRLAIPEVAIVKFLSRILLRIFLSR